jgi:hypothetical protein
VNTASSKKDSVVDNDVNVVTVENKEKIDSTNIKVNIQDHEITITPIDNKEGIIVEGKHYKNVILKLKKSDYKTSYTNNSREHSYRAKDSTAIVKTTKTEVIKNNTKEVNRGTRYYLIFWLFVLILIMYILWRSRQ